MLLTKKLLGKTALALGLITACACTTLPAAASSARLLAQSSTPTAEESISDEVAPATRAKIEELLAITNSNVLNAQVMEGIIAQFRQVSPEVPDEWWDRFIEKVDYEELNEIIIPIYAQNFTDEELDGIIAFYRTPVGQSVLEKMPNVIQESLLAGQSWGLRIGREVVDELAADGYDVPVR